MAMLLRKVWATMSAQSNSNNGRNENQHVSMSPVDQLPSDVFVMVFKFLHPKEASRASLVCKSWRDALSDNRLWMLFLQNQLDSWDSILFAETHLRNGFPLQSHDSCLSELPFKQIHNMRAQVHGSIIIDGGSGYCKYGWSKYASPSGRSATFLEFGNIETPMPSRLRQFFATIYSRMQVKPSGQPVVVSTPICHTDDTESAKAARKQLREAIYTVLFDMNVPAVCAVDQAVLALYAARCTSGIVVNIGFQVTSVVPILRGKVMHDVGVEVIGQGALRLTGYLSELMHQKGIHFESMYTVRTLKENLCYVATDYEAEQTKYTEASYDVPGEGFFTLSKERFQTGEILFQPHLGGLRTMALHQAVALCMEHCHIVDVAPDHGWYKTVVLAGGSSCLPGLAARLEKELQRLLPHSISEGVKVFPPSHGPESAWFGAKLISNISTFPERWYVTKKQFRRRPGPEIVHAMAGEGSLR
ncbi:actin-related protein 8 isoform X1 [Amborella trichopoda]|uniref:F-box domain-containing protein n=1 Tax=Amborella trichopoda TaxID=13333 RepID=U5DF55_AMBTC|nr:actin-related protein 8 isoform X1 [Amborella trichopoda]ERN19028.1 hypothetical protein AMTR_s00061p00061880 [Amborella trichopoda]|eukprot:XP_006857561.1 actin-related protein 8 isoform X1 [Amborella trichopoda]